MGGHLEHRTIKLPSKSTILGLSWLGHEADKAIGLVEDWSWSRSL